MGKHLIVRPGSHTGKEGGDCRCLGFPNIPVPHWRWVERLQDTRHAWELQIAQGL